MTTGLLDLVKPVVGRALSALFDPTVVLSFDRTGFAVHSLSFVAGDLDVDLSGRLCLVTGANSGIGFAAASALAARGAEVWLLCRDAGRGGAAAAAIHSRQPGARVRVEVVDVSELASIRAFAARLGDRPVDVLVHNAGILPSERVETRDGVESTWATNVTGPFYLTALLRRQLEAAAQGRVILVSSGGMYSQRLDLSDPEHRQRPFDGVAAYALTKRAQVVLAELWAERWRASRVTVHAMHPGWADTPAVRTSLPNFWRLTRAILRTPEQGADTLVWLACCPRLAHLTGKFWFDRVARWTHWIPGTRETAADRAALWALCCATTGLDAGTLEPLDQLDQLDQLDRLDPPELPGLPEAPQGGAIRRESVAPAGADASAPAAPGRNGFASHGDPARSGRDV